ncbi:polysaccharide deacetylase family protein [Adhaeretor mobilis]|uniref:Polysaccharide deacetylase n=1 Tax=Adhaeretor mobilis TaxID=1930276 RepID=A0A517MXJ3_9BACT|nr:polysaccharide deacetylase family protein [Adhaeretor mobilis]QDS99537.1 Polysaccharide deacetylase [Adhaeretor mobilis]
MLPEACREPLLGMYYLATLPGRRQAAARRAIEGSAPIRTLFYHRVADDHPNGWTISTERFKDQIEWIQERYEIITLIEAQRRIGSDQNSTAAVCLTFDDGYADNCREALPWLLDKQIPFTYFVSTNRVNTGEPFDHDVEAGQPLAPNSIEEIRVLAEAGVEIGAHTRSHADCGKIDNEDELYDEIVGSKRDLEAMIHRPVRYFAFPFGLEENLSRAAFRTAFRAGFWGVCSAYGGYNLPGEDPFHIQRIHGDSSWARFCNWLTVDPRKLRNVQRFNAGDYRLCF